MLKVPSPDVKHETAIELAGIETGQRRPNGSFSSSRHSLRGQQDFEEDLQQFQPVSLFCLKKNTKPRIWFIKFMLWPWFERVSILVILVNCVTLGMYNPFDESCATEQCQVLERLETAIYAFFVMEMLIKWVAMGLFGKQGYFKDSWNKLDCFIVAAGTFELAYGEGEYLTAVRSIRVLRPLRAINRVPSIRILVMLLLDTLPMLGNVLAICFFIFAIFGIIGVQLWQGILRSRCFPDHGQINDTIISEYNLSSFYQPSFDKPDYVCSLPGYNGLSKCDQSHFNHHDFNGQKCNYSYPLPLNASSTSCVDWNRYYTTCRDSGVNINYGAISFDNIGSATVAIFQIITLEGWTDIMYKIQDAHSFWNWLYFVVLILLGSYFMTNLCLVVITSQFQETKSRETDLLRISRLRSRPSVSTTGSSFFQQGCYTQILQYVEHLCRVLRRRVRSSLKLDKPPNHRRVRPCLQLKRSKGNVKSIHHHHHHYHYYHHYVHHHPCQCSNFEISDTPSEPAVCSDISSGMSPPSAEPAEISSGASSEQASGVPKDKQDSRSTKEDMRIMVVPEIKVFAQAAAALYKDSGTNSSAEMVSTATANINVQGHDSSASVVTYSKAADPVTLATQATAKTIEAACSCAAHQSSGENVRVVTKAYEGSSDSCEDEISNKGTRRGKSCSERFRGGMKVFVEDTWFTRVIMMSILFNTICMAVEHHGQPEKMTDILEIFNIIFTIIFALEMLGKVIAFGPYGYIKDAYNLFDGIIVIVSLMDIIADSDTTGISVLRSFRLLRIFKLVRFMPALQRQLSVMVKTLDNVMTFLALLSLFIFTSSILGMHLFGGKYQFEDESGQLVTSRANFDTLFWALVTVFQVLTQEDWNVVLYDGIRALSSWAALYFIFLMIIGNYILFNLLVAILVEGFADHSENERLSLKEGKELLASKVDRKPKLNNKELAISWPSLSTPDRNVERRHVTRCKSAPERPPNISQKPQRSHSYLHVLTVDALDSELSAEETGAKYAKRCVSPADEDMSLVPMHARLASQENSETDIERPSCFKQHELWSLYVFSPQNRFRLLMIKLHSHVWFDRVVLLFILFNCIIMALEEPGLDQNSRKWQFIHIMQYIFTALFTIEMSIKVVSLGLVIGPDTYLRSGWNIIDGVLVLLSLVDLVVSLTTHTHSGILGVLRVFRAFRTLRPLRVINRAPELKLVVETLLSSLKPIGNVVLIAATFFTIFGILGVQLFKGKFYSCHNVPSNIVIKNKSQCLLHNGNWLNNEYNFDHLARALLTLFVFATKDGWVSIMYSGVDAVGVDQQPKRDYSKWNVLYFVAFLLLAGFVVLNMLVGIVVENFHKCRNELLKEQNAKKTTGETELPQRSRSDSVSDIDYESFSCWRQKVFFFVTHEYFDLAIAVVIGVNVLCMAMEHYNQPEDLTLFLKCANYVFTIMFIIEAVLKIIALGCKNYFRNRWNCLDMTIVVLSIGGIILDELATSNFPMNPTIIRVMRVLRITRVLKLLKTAEGIRSLLDTVGKALPQVANLGLLFLLLFFIFGALGMELFGKITCDKVECEGLDTHAHFRNFGYSVLTLFRVSTGDNWNGILKDTMDSKRCQTGEIEGCEIIQSIAPVYFASFVLITQFVLLNVVVAVMMKHLEEAKVQEANSFKSCSPGTPEVVLKKRTPDTTRRSKSSPRLLKRSQQSLRSKKIGVSKVKCRGQSQNRIQTNNLSSDSESDCSFQEKDASIDLRQRKPSFNNGHQITAKCKYPKECRNSVNPALEVLDCESSESPVNSPSPPNSSLKVPIKSFELPVKTLEPFVRVTKPVSTKCSDELIKPSQSPVHVSGPVRKSSKSSLVPFVKPSEPSVKSSEPLRKSSTHVVNSDELETPRERAVVEKNVGPKENESPKKKEFDRIEMRNTESKDNGKLISQKEIYSKISQENKNGKLSQENKVMGDETGKNGSEKLQYETELKENELKNTEDLKINDLEKCLKTKENKKKEKETFVKGEEKRDDKKHVQNEQLQKLDGSFDEKVTETLRKAAKLEENLKQKHSNEVLSPKKHDKESRPVELKHTSRNETQSYEKSLGTSLPEDGKGSQVANNDCTGVSRDSHKQHGEGNTNNR